MTGTYYTIALKTTVNGVKDLSKNFKNTTESVANSVNKIKNTLITKTKEEAKNSMGKLINVNNFMGGLANSIKSAIEFENIMLRATYKIDNGLSKNSQSFKNLQQLVSKLGSSTVYSSKQIAESLNLLAAAGKNTEEIIVLLPKILDFANVNQITLAESSDMITEALNVFNLSSKDIAKLTKNNTILMENMTKVADMSSMSLKELFEAMVNGGNIFTITGQNLQTFNAALMVLADNGKKGGDAGASLKNIILNILGKNATEELNNLGIVIKNKKGDIKDFFEILDDLKKSTEKMDINQQLKTFENLVNKENVEELIYLIKDGGKALRDYRVELEKSNNYVSEKSNILKNTAEDNFKIFQNSLDNFSLTFGTFLLPAVISVINSITNLINIFKDICEKSPVMKAILISTFSAIGIYAMAVFSPLSAIIFGITSGIALMVKGFQSANPYIVGLTGVITSLVFALSINNIGKFGLALNTAIKGFIAVYKSANIAFMSTSLGLFLMACFTGYKLGKSITNKFEEQLSNIENDSFMGKIVNFGAGFGWKSNKELIGSGSKKTENYLNYEKAQNIPISQQVLPYVMKVVNNNNINNNNNLNNNTQTLRSILDVNINSQKFNTNYSLSGVQNSQMLINVNGGQ